MSASRMNIFAALCAAVFGVLSLAVYLMKEDNAVEVLPHWGFAVAVGSACASWLIFPWLGHRTDLRGVLRDLWLTAFAILLGVVFAGSIVVPVIRAIYAPVVFSAVVISSPVSAAVILLGIAAALALARYPTASAKLSTQTAKLTTAKRVAIVAGVVLSANLLLILLGPTLRDVSGDRRGLIIGPADVIDADTMLINGMKLRLAGIDAIDLD